ncbi:hypothetical protein F5Y18DRAFT_335777 [Xylariaceae sp. FL1019]|nr:hypothetical protein F5Y18DRAFT_335777 [Xylariaceae sp. FL1019]
MSADLFAAFDDSSQSSTQRGQPWHTQPSVPQSSNHGVSFGPPQTQSFAPQPSTQWGQNLPAFNAAPSPLAAQSAQAADEEDDEDGWGDFEVASHEPAPRVPPQRPSARSAVQRSSAHQDIRPNRIVRATTLELISISLIGVEENAPPTRNNQIPTSQPAPWAISTIQPHKDAVRVPNPDPNVLFDADDFDGDETVDDFEDEDDFGDFETVASPPDPPIHSIAKTLNPSSIAPSIQKASDLLLGLDLNDKPSQVSKSIEPRPSGSFWDELPIQQQNTAAQPTVRSTAQMQNTVKDPGHATNDPWDNAKEDWSNGEPFEKDEDWGSFDDLPANSVRPAVKSTPRPTNTSKELKAKAQARSTAPTLQAAEDDSSWDWDPVDVPEQAVNHVIDGTALPPINIPPPSVIMSAFPELFDQANDHLYKPLSGQPAAVKSRILAEPKVHEFLKGYLGVTTVAARVLAGRKLRWHRDKFLSQSMSISAAGGKGMKLAGVDKTQTAREDREAADVVSKWKAQVGRLRSTVATVNSSAQGHGEHLRIPEIHDTIQISTAKDVPTSAKACVVCGLKRNERIGKVDYDVEDSFGEWWVEHWGHVDCKRFWLKHEGTLRQR